MTATADYVHTPPTCPKCNGGMWDQKNGKFPWKPGTPIYKCKDKACATAGGVIWEPKVTVTTTATAKTPVVYAANKPQAEIPPLLRNAEAEDNAELAQKIGVDLSGIQKDLAVYQAMSEFVLQTIAPIYEKAKIGMSPESAAACVQTLFINSTGGRK